MLNNQLKVTVDRKTLLETIKKNREKFREDYELAKKGFRIELRKELAKKIRLLDEGKKVDLTFKNHKPDNHLSKYDEIIEMLEMSGANEVELDSDAFKKYVKNEWDWARYWHTSNSMYMLSASSN